MQSLRFRIVFFYISLLVLMLTGFSILLYQKQRQELCRNLDDLLFTRAQGIADAIDTYWEVEKIEAEKDGLSMEMMSKINNINFSKIAQRWLHEESAGTALLNIIVQILDAEGTIIANSKNIPRAIMLPRTVYRNILEGRARYETFSISFDSDETMLLRAYVMPVFENNTVAYIVQVAGPLDRIHSSLNSLKKILFLLFPIIILITGAIGLILTNTILKPVDKMINDVCKISANNLTARIHIPKARDEMQRLALTFNDMLDRIESAFLSQKRFVQDVSHQLKTPLTITKGELEVAIKKKRSVDEYVEMIASSLEEIDLLIRITENLLTLTRFDEKKLMLNFETFDIQLLLREVVDDVSILADRKKISMQCNAMEKKCITGDRSQLRQAFFNFFDNAVKYTPSGGKIAVSLENGHDEVLIKIQDSGIGISSEELPHIFNRFYRTQESRSSGGFGLGLSISKAIVEAHKGSIAVSSSPGEGTAVSIFLPVSNHNNRNI